MVYYPDYKTKTDYYTTREALTGKKYDPNVRALENYDENIRRMAQVREAMGVLRKNYEKAKAGDEIKKQQRDQGTMSAVTGVSSTALNTYGLGKELGLWGGKAGSALSQGGTSPAITTNIPLGAEEFTGGLTQAGELLTPFSASETALGPSLAAGLPEIGAGTEAAALGGGSGLGTLTGTASSVGLPAVASAVAPAVTAGTSAGIASAAAPMAIGTEVATMLPTVVAGAAEGGATLATSLAPLFTLLCCFIFIEGEGELTEIVRRYRDEHYLNSFVSVGYKKMASWLVPLMKKYKLIKLMVKYTMTRPLTHYAEWYYGLNKYGWLCTPHKLFWTKLWDFYGQMIVLQYLEFGRF